MEARVQLFGDGRAAERIVATAGDLRQTRQIIGGTGVTQDEMVAHFGLGSRQRVDRLEVFWPSGQVDLFEDLPADQQIRLVEGRPAYHRVRPTTWTHTLPDSVGVDQPISLEVNVRPALFDVRRNQACQSGGPFGPMMPAEDLGR